MMTVTVPGSATKTSLMSIGRSITTAFLYPKFQLASIRITADDPHIAKVLADFSVGSAAKNCNAAIVNSDIPGFHHHGFPLRWTRTEQGREGFATATDFIFKPDGAIAYVDSLIGFRDRSKLCA